MKKRILFILPNLNQGGAQKVILTVLNHLDRSKFEPYLAVVRDIGDFHDLVPKHIPCEFLNSSRVRYSIFKLLGLIRRNKPDVIVSTLGYLNLALCFLKPLFPRQTTLVIREGSVVSELFKNKELPGYFRPMIKYVYNFADSIICQSKYMLEDLVDNFRASRKKVVLIYNPVDIQSINVAIRDTENPFGCCSGPNIVAMGRMAREKNLDKLLKAFDIFRSEVHTAQLWLVGDGALLKDLRGLAADLGIQDAVHFLGFQKNPYIWLKHADLFVMCSEYEGLPNGLLEALACGCPVVASNCPGGTAEIMELTGNPDRLIPADKLVLTQDMFQRKDYEPILKALEKNFGLNAVMQAYEKILSNSGN